jgi:hypothetical protein
VTTLAAVGGYSVLVMLYGGWGLAAAAAHVGVLLLFLPRK